MNIIDNYIKCPICKNIFYKVNIKAHYQKCKISDVKTTSHISNQNVVEETKKIYQQSHQKQKQQYPQQQYSQHHQQYNQPISMEIEKYIQPQITNFTDSMLNHFFKEYEKLFYYFIQGKCIALVGPAQSIIGTEKGSVIDKFDIVVRLNKSIPLPDNLKNDIGSKTDIIYNSLNTIDFPGQNNLNTSSYKKYGVKFVCSSYPYNHPIFKEDILNYIYRYKFDLPLKVMNDLKFRNFENSLGTRPYTGTCAIMDLLSYPIKYLYITGLDFYQTKYYSEYRRISKEGLKHTKNSVIHQARPQLDYLKNISFFDDRIILDTFLDKLLYHDYYKVAKNLTLFDKNEIFNFGDKYFQKYFEMKISPCTFTKQTNNSNTPESDNAHLIFTDNKNYNKNNNEYCLFVTNDINMLNFLNNNMQSKKFIGNFFYTENKFTPASIYITIKFLNSLKVILNRIGINNCSINLAILLSIMLYLPDKHYFSKNEIFNSWKLSSEEKKLVIFLYKKKILLLRL